VNGSEFGYGDDCALVLGESGADITDKGLSFEDGKVCAVETYFENTLLQRLS
jgi:hypothetical protein